MQTDSRNARQTRGMKLGERGRSSRTLVSPWMDAGYRRVVRGKRRSLSLLLPLALAGCSRFESDELRVFAAASATGIVTELAESFDRARVRTSFGPSSGLARQIRDGAPADVYISASRRWIEFLEEEKVLSGAPRVICRNRLLCVAPQGSRLLRDRPSSAKTLLRALAEGDRVAIADAGVPAGDYARQSLAASGDLESLGPFFVGQEDVRAVLRAVESGQAAAGFVYATDARAARVAELFTLSEGTHAPIEYFACVPRSSSDPGLAAAFLDHLLSPETRRVLARAGFQVDMR